MTPIPPKSFRIFPRLVAVLSLLTVFDAAAVVLGELRSSSRLGELLHAEIDVDDEPADRFDTSCVKLYRPAQTSAELPWITEARLSFRRESGQGRLYISSDHPLRDPVVQIGVQSTCAGERMWRDYTVLVSPTGMAGRETPPPAKPLAAGHRVERVAHAAPPPATQEAREAQAGAGEPAARPVRKPRGISVIGVRGGDGILVLRLASELRLAGPASEAERDMLRVEYRMLTALYDQVDSQLASAAKLRELERAASQLQAAGERLGAGLSAAPNPAASPAPQPASAIAPVAPAAVSTVPALPQPVREVAVPLAIPKAGPEVLSSEAADDLIGWPLYAGLGAAALGVALLVRRRRRAAALDAYLLPMHAPTIVVDEPEFSVPPEKVGAVAVELANETNDGASPPAAVPPVAQDVPPPPEKLEVTPVMELAEIMLSFGRVHGAAQTLQEYIEANPKEALQPWIRLLEIYRENGMRAEFETLAANLNQNFNVEIVHWDKAAPGERIEMTLELLPHIRDQIDSLWGRPECVDYLQKLLRDNRDGQRSGFALPVVKEILVLIDLMVAEKAAAK